MKLSKLTQAISIALTALALSACGGSDDDTLINNTNDTNTTPATQNQNTPQSQDNAQSPSIDPAEQKQQLIVSLAKLRGLNDTNAAKFAQAVKDLEIGSDAYLTALETALETQKIELENATKPVSPVVLTNNPFVRGINTAEKLSSGNSFYVRQSGANYDRGANPGDMSGLGELAIDDPTGDGGNPYLSNFVIGVETLHGEIRAIDSTGELALPIEGSNRGKKISDTESLYVTNDGLRYNTNRTANPKTLIQRLYNPRYPSGQFPFYSNTHTHLDASGNPIDKKALDRASGLIENCEGAVGNRQQCDGGRAKDMAAGDYDYDYSAVHIAPRRNDGWKASNVNYINKTWEKWSHNSSSAENPSRGCKTPSGSGGCTTHYSITTHTPYKASNEDSKGDFDPWRDGEQWLQGNNHAQQSGGDCYPYTTGDCTADYSYYTRQVKGQSDDDDNNNNKKNEKKVKSARWTGERIYRHHYEFRANNLVDESEGDIINSTGAYSRAKDNHTSTDPIQNTTIDFVGRPASTGSAGNRENKTYNYGLGLGHGHTYGSNQAVNANLEDAFGRKIYTIQEINRRKVKVSENAVTDAETFAKFVGTPAQFSALSTINHSQAINANDLANDNHLKMNADPYYTIRERSSGVASLTLTPNIEKQRRYDTGLIVYSNHSKRVEGDEKQYGYKKPIFGIEENVYIADGDDIKVINHLYDETIASSIDSVKDASKTNDDKNSFFSVAKEKRMVYHQPCRGGITGQSGCRPYERKGHDWADGYSVATNTDTSGLNDDKNFANAWDELDFDNRKYNNPEGLDQLNSGISATAGQFKNSSTYDSILGVQGDTWRRMEQWRRLTVMRESRNPLETGVAPVKVANNLETRVYGKNYRDLEAGAEGFQDTHNSYVGNFKTIKGTDGNDDTYQMTKIAPTKLHNVQYGRLTNNIDILTQAELSKRDYQRILYRQFQEHGAPNTVDTYFYRGTNRTTMEQMDAIKAKGGVINYRGHALTYNLGPIVETKQSIPTAYGSDNGATIGNFVQAKFDTATGKVDGSIYNFLNKDVSADANKFMRQDLVTFTGDVYGNTVTGTATKLGITPEQGTLTASFYGESANELGGAINSLTREQGYGDAKWGAVFGATRGTMVDQFNIIETNPTTP